MRGTSRREEGLAAIEAAGIEPALADPTAPGTVLDLVGDVAVVVWLLGSAQGSAEELAASTARTGAGARAVRRNARARLRLRGGGERRPDAAGAGTRGGRGRLRALADPERGAVCRSGRVGGAGDISKLG